MTKLNLLNILKLLVFGRRIKKKVKSKKARTLQKLKKKTKSGLRIKRKHIRIKHIRHVPKRRIRHIAAKEPMKTKPKPVSIPARPKPPKLSKVHLPRIHLPKITLPKLRMMIPKKISPKAKNIPPLKELSKAIAKESIVADVMTRNVVTVKPTDPLIYVVRLFSDKEISGAPVVQDYDIVGIISESDIAKFVETKNLLNASSSGLKKLQEVKVGEVMHRKAISVHEYTKLSGAIDLMNRNNITRLPVLNEKQNLVGIITRSNIIHGISKELLLRILAGKPGEMEKVRMKIDTEIDDILEIVEKKGSINIGEIRQKLMLPEDKIEEWGKILEKHDLIELFYPPIGKPEFRKKLK